jgi:hypothetical protein
VAINDVPAQTDFYSSANGRLLNDCCAMPAMPIKRCC